MIGREFGSCEGARGFFLARDESGGAREPDFDGLEPVKPLEQGTDDNFVCMTPIPEDIKGHFDIAGEEVAVSVPKKIEPLHFRPNDFSILRFIGVLSRSREQDTAWVTTLASRLTKLGFFVEEIATLLSQAQELLAHLPLGAEPDTTSSTREQRTKIQQELFRQRIWSYAAIRTSARQSDQDIIVGSLLHEALHIPELLGNLQGIVDVRTRLRQFRAASATEEGSAQLLKELYGEGKADLLVSAPQALEQYFHDLLWQRLRVPSDEQELRDGVHSYIVLGAHFATSLLEKGQIAVVSSEANNAVQSIVLEFDATQQLVLRSYFGLFGQCAEQPESILGKSGFSETELRELVQEFTSLCRVRLREFSLSITERLKLAQEKEQQLQEEIQRLRSIAFKSSFIDPNTSLVIEELGLSTRICNAFKREGITSLQKLAEYSEDDLMNLRKFGETCLKELKQKLAQHGLLRNGS